MLSVKIQLFFFFFHKMKEKLCCLVTVVIFQYIEEKPVGKSCSTVPFIPAGKESIFQHLQVEIAADRDEWEEELNIL